MYLLKFRLENSTEPCSIYTLLNEEARTFDKSIEEIKKGHTEDEISFAIKNEIHTFKSIEKLLEQCEMIELSHDEYQLLGKLHLGNSECAAKYVFDAVCEQKIHFEPKETMEMGM